MVLVSSLGTRSGIRLVLWLCLLHAAWESKSLKCSKPPWWTQPSDEQVTQVASQPAILNSGPVSRTTWELIPCPTPDIVVWLIWGSAQAQVFFKSSHATVLVARVENWSRQQSGCHWMNLIPLQAPSLMGSPRVVGRETLRTGPRGWRTIPQRRWKLPF